MDGLTISIPLDRNTAPGFYDLLWRIHESDQFSRQLLNQRLTQITTVQAEHTRQLAAIVHLLQQRTADSELATVAREAKAVIDETTAALDIFTPGR